MRGVYIRTGSPFYWLRFYDKLEPELRQRRKSICTKVVVTAADWKKWHEAHAKGKRPKLAGTFQLRRMLEEFRVGLAERNITVETGVKFIKTPILSEGFKEFKRARTVPGMPGELKPNTLGRYDIAVARMIKAASDKEIRKYNEKDYENLLHLLEKDGLSMNSRSIYTRALHSLWEFFVGKKYATANVVTAVMQEKKDADPIPLEDLAVILDTLRADTDRAQNYYIIAFMALTGCRPSTAIMQARENIDFAEGLLKMENVKVSKKRQRSFYYFPLHAGLRALFGEMGVGSGSVGRLFSEFPVVENHMTQPLRSFWDRLNGKLVREGLIESRYTLKQIRPAFVSYAVNILKMNPYEVQKLVDHSDIKLTTAVYLKYEIKALTPALNKINLTDKKVLQSVLQLPEGEPVTETEAVQVLE